MFILFFIVWVILNGRITLEICLFGIVLAAAMEFFLCRFTDFTPRAERMLLRNLPLALRYGVLLVAEIFKANWKVITLVLSPKYEPEPVLVRFRVPLKTQTARVVLANSITLTPGTITVALEEDEYTVHCLDKDMAEGLESGPFVTMLQKMEAKGHA